MKILTIIPARSGSKGIPNKNIKDLGGKTLIWYSIEAAKNINYNTRIIVDTDSQEIAKIAESFGVEVPYLRPAYLAEDSTPSVDVVMHTLDWFEEQGERFDAVLLLQPTTPFRTRGLIDNCIETFIKQGVDSLITVLPVPHAYNPYWQYFSDESGNLRNVMGRNNIISKRQDLPQCWHRDGSVYISKVGLIRENRELVGGIIGFVVGEVENYCNLDEPKDWKIAEAILNRIPK